MPSLSPTTLRLIGCLESLGTEEEGALGREDWQGLAQLFQRECALISQLARQPDRVEPVIADRAQALRERYRELDLELSRRRESIDQELVQLREAGQRSQGVQAAYGRTTSSSRSDGRQVWAQKFS